MKQAVRIWRASTWSAISLALLPHASAIASEITSWAFVDDSGSSTSGINYNAASAALNPVLVPVSSTRMYALWAEANGSINQIRAALYNANDGAPSWRHVEKSSPDANGINYSTSKTARNPSAIAFNGKLYATWEEISGSGGATQIRVKVYNGNDSAPSWKAIEKASPDSRGLNKDSGMGAAVAKLAAHNGKLYAAWQETGGKGCAYQQIRIALYNGNDNSPAWSFVDGNGKCGLNYVTGTHAFSPVLTSVNGTLYAIWTEGVTARVRVKAFNGNDAAPAWTSVDGGTGLNFDPSISAGSIVQSEAFNGKLYVSWTENRQVRVKSYNGSSWRFVEKAVTDATGINQDPSINGGSSARLVVFNSKLYGTWPELNGTANQIRVKVYNGDDNAPAWTSVDGDGILGLNKDTSVHSYTPSAAVFNGKLYNIWREGQTGQIIPAVAIESGF